MSKLITTRYEYAIYDDAASGANLTAQPPVYPTVIDDYQTEVVASTGQSFGSTSLTRADAGSSQILVPQGASLICVAPTTNVQNLVIKTQTGASIPLVPNGTAQPLFWTVSPGQTVTVPAVFNSTSTPLIVFSVDTTNAAANPTNATWNLQILWSL